MTGARGRILRLSMAAVFALAAVVSSVPTSTAAPSKAQVEAAKAKLAELNHRTDLLVEQYDQARLALEQTRSRLADLRKTKAEADAAAKQAMADLQERAVSAFTGMGSQLDAILDASSFADFTDRLQYMGALAQGDEDLAAKAEAAGAQARWAAEELTKTADDETRQRDALVAKIADIKDAAAEQQALFEKLDKDYQAALAAQRAAELAAQQALDDGGNGGNGGDGGGDFGGFVPPPNATAAQTAIAAARSVIGVPYVWGAADPDVGFDCSGLTMWAYAQAGVSLPHSSAAQYAMLPHVSREDLQPGDLLFFYSPVSHVSLYVGNNQMVDASHSGTTISERAVFWDNFVGGGRPT